MLSRFALERGGFFDGVGGTKLRSGNDILSLTAYPLRFSIILYSLSPFAYIVFLIQKFLEPETLFSPIGETGAQRAIALCKDVPMHREG